MCIRDRGSSWHSGDSMLTLLLWCHLDSLVILLCALAAYARWRSVRRTAVVAAGLCVLTVLQHHMGVMLFETLLGRPWIWLLMT